jgi:hypothetical protein
LADTWLDYAIALQYPKAIVFKESLEDAHIENGPSCNTSNPPPVAEPWKGRVQE